MKERLSRLNPLRGLALAGLVASAIHCGMDLRADVVICDNWGFNGNRNPPNGIQFLGTATRSIPYNDPVAVALLINTRDTYAGLLFQTNTQLDGLSVSFGVDLHGGDAADGISFSYAPFSGAYLNEFGNTNGLAVCFKVDGHDNANVNELDIYYKGTLVARNTSIPLWATQNNQPATCRAPILFSMTVAYDGTLTYSLQRRNDEDCSIASTWANSVNLGPNQPVSDPTWVAYFGARSGSGSTYGNLDGIDIRGHVLPRLVSIPDSVQANQDQPSAPIPLTLTSTDPGMPAANAVLTVVSENTTLIPNGSIQIDPSGATRNLVFQGASGQYGTTFLDVTVSYPNYAGTITYRVAAAVNRDAPPTLTLQPSASINQGRSLQVPVTWGSQQWSLANKVQVAVAELPPASGPLLQNGALVLIPGTPPDAPGAWTGTLAMTPRLDRAGNTTIQVTVTDGSGLSTASTMSLAVGPQIDPPTVMGAHTAVSLNENGASGQYAEDPSGLGALGSHCTIEAWVRPSALPNSFNPIVSFGAHLPAQYAMLALTQDGKPCFAGNSNDAFPNSVSSVPLNAWSHVAVTIDGQAVTFYVNGEFAASAVLNSIANIQNGPFAVGLDEINRYTFNGQLDEVRIWNVVHSPVQIQSTFRSEVPPSPGLIRYFDFDEGFVQFLAPGTQWAVDRSGIGAPLQLFNLPAYVAGAGMDTTIQAVEQQSVLIPTVAANVQGTNFYGTYGLSREVYINTAASRLIAAMTNSPDYPTNPSANGPLGDFVETPPLLTGLTGERLRGYLVPPQTGNYTFWIAGNAEAQLWLGTNSQPASKVQIATSPSSGVAFRQWGANPSQKSAAIPLVAGQRYYFEVLHQSYLQDQTTRYHVSVQWQLPDGKLESPIPASRLQPVGLPPNGQPQIVVTDPPDHGTIVLTNGGVLYKPVANFYGVDDMFYYAVDNGRTSAVAHVVLQVNNAFDRPSAGLNTALIFDGSSGRVETTGSLSLSNRSFTLEAWAARPDPLAREWLISQGQASTDGGLVFGWDASGNQAAFKLGFWGDDLQMATPFADTNWHHWAATFDVNTKTRTLYLDGVPVATDTAGSALEISPLATLHLGSQFGGAPFFHGGMAEVRVWDHARSREEIQSTMNAPLTGAEEGLMLYYRLNEGNGLTVNDSSTAPPYQSAVQGAISGGVAWVTNASRVNFVAVPRNLGQAYTANRIFLPGFDPDGTQLTYYLAGGSTNGFATIQDFTRPYVDYTPNLYARGGDQIRYFVKNATGTASAIATIMVSITESNLPPTLSSFLDQVVEEEDPPLALPFTVADLDAPASSLTVTGFCSNPILLPQGSITFSGTGGNRVVTLNPVVGEIGSGTVVITVSDGQLSTSQEFNYVVKGRLVFAPIDIGGLTGQPYSEATGINAAGQVVGFGSDSQTNHRRGFSYSGFGLNAQTVSIGTLGGDGSQLNGVNASGMAVGWSASSSAGVTNVILANPLQSISVSSLGSLIGGTVSTATAINDDGFITGYGDSGASVQHPFLAPSTGPLQDIGVPSGAHQAFGLAINNSRVVAGYSVANNGITNAFLYNAGNSNFSTLTLSSGATGSMATALNEAGEVAGCVFVAGQMHAALALSNSWTDLGDVLGGGAARLNDLNALRQGVGTAQDTNHQWQAFYYENGRTYNLNTLLPLDSGWTLVDARAINDQGQIVGVGQKDGLTRAFLLFPATEIGRRVYRPLGTVASAPQISIIQADPGNNSQNSFIWSDNDQKLFAVRPVAALIQWHTGRYQQYTNFTQIGDTVITQVFTNEVLTPTLSFNVWPGDARLQVASSPVELQPPFAGFNYSFVEMSYSTIDGAAVDPNTKIFNTQLGDSGYSVFRYLVSNGRPANPQSQKIRFDVARTIRWDEPHYLNTNLSATVGVVLTNAAHKDYPGRNGWLVSSNAYYDGAGPNAAYNRANRGGVIIPVNAVTNRDDFIVAWYDFDPLGVAWPEMPVKYHVLWPTNAPHIVIASGLGTGALDPAKYLNAQIYNQPDVNQPGFNPNEEHALLAPAAGGSGTGPALFALRNDLNRARGGVPADSEAFALLKYQDPASQQWRIQPYQVVAEEDPYYFSYPGTAGTQISPPYPLSVLPQSPNTYAASGPAWQDVAGRFYALAGGEPSGQSAIVMRYFYPLQPGFWYDLNNDGTNDVANGTSIPWLNRLQPDQDVGQPADVTYQISWPADVPVLAVGETLYGATHGLPDINDMASAQVVYDSLSALNATNGDFSQLARLFDPISARTVPLANTNVLAGLNLATDPTTGLWAFTDLPYYLRVRFFYDPSAHTLGFKGVSLPQAVGQPLTLINVMSLRERNRIQQLDGAKGVTDFDTLVQKLYVMTRNPNQLDIQPRDGVPDDALLIGLTYDSTGTNVTTEQLGSGPKALTAGLPQILTPATEPNSLSFDGNTGTAEPASTTGPFADVTNNFTVEFWANPTQGRLSTTESNDDIDTTGVAQGRFALFPPVGDQYYGARHASAGISIGTNGVSVFQHTGFYLPAVLVYDTPISGWTHVAVTYTNGRASLYLNGTLVHVGQPLLSGYTVHPGYGLGGNQSRPDFGRYAGSLNEVRIWNYAVPQSVLQARMGRRLTGSETGLVGCWRLHDGVDTAVSDSGPRHLPLTMAGGVQWDEGSAPTFLFPHYQVVAENNDPTLSGQPVVLHVIEVSGGPYTGSLQTILPDDVMDQRTTMRHNADFAGDPQLLEFQWYYYPAAGGDAPPLPDPANPTANGWIPFPDSGQGVNDITVGEGDVSSLITMSDNWFIMRYRGYMIDGQTNWSAWIGDPSSTTVPRPMLLEGWIQRVLAGINLFNQRNTDFLNFQVNTLVSSLAQAGQRYEGDVALNPGALDTPGLIQIYQTVLDRGLSLSANGTPPVDYAPADQALLLAAGKISDLYMLFGNEASADAADPTIGLNPRLPSGGSLASSLFAFENQVSSLLEEELCLLRGRDDSSAGVGAAPVYNRLFWNFTGGDGEVAYVATYNMSDYNADGSINAADAAILYPQGHGDAWGHYLTALTAYYNLLRNPNFTWTPQTEDVVLGGTSLEVGYLHERKFAAAAKARTITGVEIMDRTFRWDYSDDPTRLWAGYKDSNPQRAWGVTEWGWRAGAGALFDWVAGNAILPASDTNHTGIQKIDRTTVPELAQITSDALRIQSILDSSDQGYNPLGLSANTVPFDLDPTTLQTGPFRTTHFDQIYARALSALQNAVTTFNQASELTDALRVQADSESNFGSAVELQELAYRNQLIGFFGYPYSGDIGPNTANPSGYIGPDLYHWMYVDVSAVTPETTAPQTNFTALYKAFTDGAGHYGFQFSADTLNQLDTGASATLQVNYPISLSGYFFQPPPAWGSRQAEGSLQTSLRNIAQAQTAFAQASAAYNSQVAAIRSQLNLLEARYALNDTQIRILNSRLITQSTMHSAVLVAQGVQLAADEFSQTTSKITGGLVEAYPKVVGLADDPFAPIRGALLEAEIVPQQTLQTLKNAAALGQAGAEFAQAETDLILDTQQAQAQITFDEAQAVIDLQAQVRTEAGLRLSLVQQANSLMQAVNTYQTTLAQANQLLQQRLVYRQLTSGSLAEMRYGDLAFRIFRNDALQRYDTQFGLASRYVYLAAKAFDYEVNLDSAGASDLATSVVAERNIGELENGVPSAGRNGLASILAQLKQNFEVLEPSLGLNNISSEQAQFSLRTEWQRITNAASWTALLTSSVNSNLWDVPEFRQYCRPFAPEIAGPQPGIVLSIPGTHITSGLNFFGKPLAPQDYSYDPSQFSTRIRSVAVWFTGYNGTLLARSPRAYLIPVGADVLRSPDALDFTPRTWQVVEQKIPIPFPANTSSPNFLADTLNLTDQFADWAKHSAILAYPDNGYNPNNFNPSTRLIGRSVANTRWMLIIPGAYLNGDADQGISDFINSVTDIKLDFQTYSASGN